MVAVVTAGDAPELDVEIVDGEVRYSVSETRDGTSGARNVAEEGATTPPEGPPPLPCPEDAPINDLPPVCFELTVPVNTETEEAEGVTIEDFAVFAPAPGIPAAEPDGIGLRKRPVNFVASAAAHTRTGELLGQPASAQFTPVGYAWDFGDGTRLVTGTPGATWEALGQDELTETPTAHTYAERGQYTVSLTTYYSVRAAYADGEWFDVPGVLPIASDPIQMRIVTVRAVLVSTDCIQNPAGVGCDTWG